MKKSLVLISALVLLTSAEITETNKISDYTATYYHSKFNGRKTASGEIYKPNKLTCASNNYELGTHVIVTNTQNGKSVMVKVNDRMAIRYSDRIDLSPQAFKKIASLHTGKVPVKVEIVNPQTIENDDRKL